MQAYKKGHVLNINSFIRHVLLEIRVLFLDLTHNVTLKQSRTFRALMCSPPCLIFFLVTKAPSGPGSPHYRGFTVTLRHITLGRTPLDEWWARRRDLYLSTHNTLKRKAFMPLAEFEHVIPASEGPQTRALDRVATGIICIAFQYNKDRVLQPDYSAGGLNSA
jgi:hypothetical protein